MKGEGPGNDVVLIEDKAPGTRLIQELVEEGLHAASYRPQADKIMRIYAPTAVPGLDPGIENGFVHLPEEAPWLALYLPRDRASSMEGTTTRSPRTPCSGGDRSQMLDWFKAAGREERGGAAVPVIALKAARPDIRRGKEPP